MRSKNYARPTSTTLPKTPSSLQIGLPRKERWRRDLYQRCLSNFSSTCAEPLLVNERQYDTVEHAFQAAKYLSAATPKEAALEAAKQFVSGGSIRGAAAAKAAGAKRGMKKLNCSLDIAQRNGMADEVMRSALRARWECDSSFRAILLEAKAEGITLLHHERGGAKSYWGGTVKGGAIVGQNKLGEMLMELTATPEDGPTKKRARNELSSPGSGKL